MLFVRSNYEKNFQKLSSIILTAVSNLNPLWCPKDQELLMYENLKLKKKNKSIKLFLLE